MRQSEFWESINRVFGRVYAKSLASDMVLGALGSRTAEQALEAGIEPGQVWEALCDMMEVEDAARWVPGKPAAK
ncbi:MAG: DUF3046 domain-containing protein [Bifidobacteriaceae bacterium]|jgi:hypothetical protein|nr:DUF3046 domain-containing protein [Bifidobacteriaceae bacterium]